MAENLEDLVRRIAYMFYEGDAIMVLVKLLEIGEPITDEELSARLKFKRADLGKVLGLLKMDGLVISEQMLKMGEGEDLEELKPSQRKKLMRDYWSLDFKSLIDSIHLKILLMKKQLREMCEEDRVFYECPKCKEEDGGRNGHVRKYIYDLNEIHAAADPDEQLDGLPCPYCHTIVEALDETAEINEKKRQADEFDTLVEPLMRIINSTSGLVLEDDPDKRCKPDKMLHRQKYEKEKERIQRERDMRRKVAQPRSSHMSNKDSNGKMVIVVDVGPQNKTYHAGDECLAFNEGLERPVVAAQKEENTIELRGKTYKSSEITNEILESLPDDEFDRVMSFLEENSK